MNPTNASLNHLNMGQASLVASYSSYNDNIGMESVTLSFPLAIVRCNTGGLNGNWVVKQLSDYTNSFNRRGYEWMDHIITTTKGSIQGRSEGIEKIKEILKKHGFTIKDSENGFEFSSPNKKRILYIDKYPCNAGAYIKIHDLEEETYNSRFLTSKS